MSDTTRRPPLSRFLRYAPRSARGDLGRQTHRGMRRDAFRVLARVRSGRLDGGDAVFARPRDVADEWSFS